MRKSDPSSSTPSEIRSETKARDHELKVISERVSLTERHFAALLKDFNAFNGGLELLREKGMKLATSLDTYSEEEYPSVKASLAGVSENLATIQDYLSAQVDFIQAKVTPPLLLTSTNCKHAREYLKEFSALREKEMVKHKALDKVKTKEPKNKGKISQMQQELQKLMVDGSRSRKTLEEHMVEFERKKIEDLQEVFSNFFHGQMLFHAKALELYTSAFHNLTSLDIEQDLEAFQNDLHPLQPLSRLDVVKNGSQTSLNQFSSQGSLGSQLFLNQTGKSGTGRDNGEDEDSDFD